MTSRSRWGWRSSSRRSSSSPTGSPAPRWCRRSTPASACSPTGCRPIPASATSSSSIRRTAPTSTARCAATARRAPATRQACDQPTAQESTQTFIKRVVAGPGDTLFIQDGHVYRNGVKEQDGYIAPCGVGQFLQFPDADQGSARSLLHDGRQPWPLRRQPFLGSRPRQMDHRGRVLHLLAPGPHRHALTAPRAAAQAEPSRPPPARLRPRRWACASSPEPTRPAAAAWPVRWWPPRCCSTSIAIGPAQARALGMLNDSKQQTPEGRAALYPVILSIAARVSIVTRCAPGHRRPRAAQDQPRRPARRAQPGGLRRLHLPQRRLPRLRGGPRAARGDRRGRQERRDRRRLGAGQGDPGPLHAPRRRSPTRAGSSPPTSATRRPSIARRSSASGSRRCTACRFSPPHISNSRSASPF